MFDSTALDLEILDIGVAVRSMLEAVAQGLWPMEPRIYRNCSSMLHRAELKLRAASFCERAA